jgi:hypothetical protein
MSCDNHALCKFGDLETQNLAIVVNFLAKTSPQQIFDQLFILAAEVCFNS